MRLTLCAELWNSHRLVEARKACLVAMVDEFLLTRARMGMPLVAGDVYSVYKENSPGYECHAICVRKGYMWHNPLLQEIAVETARLVAPLYPELRFCVPPSQTNPAIAAPKSVYMRVDITLAAPAVQAPPDSVG
jgi:hypothetical protein